MSTNPLIAVSTNPDSLRIYVPNWTH